MNHELIQNNNNFGQIFSNSNNTQTLVGRVIDIILDDKHPEFNRLGGWDSLGTIFFNEANKIISGDINLKSLPYAKPLYSYKKYYPLKNELVSITAYPNPDSQNNISLTTYYYSDIINIWNHPHHNALPQVNEVDEKIDNQYNKIGEGNTQKQKQDSTKLDLGKEFVENPNIRPLIPQEGDLIFEGRFGSSIRFSNNSLLIKSGQNPNLKDKGWIPSNENINNDLGSIYFSNTGSIDIEVASKNLKSFNINTSIDSSQIINTDKNILSNNLTPSQNIDIIPEALTYPTESVFLQPSSSFIRNVEDDFIIHDELVESNEGETIEEVKYNGVILGNAELLENKSQVIYSNASFKLGNLSGFGKINNILINKYAYPILDMIAYAEGTIFYGTKNGYDVLFGGNVISGWNNNYLQGHPNIKVKFGNSSSTAAGRYGFLYNYGWIEKNKINVPFNKTNQDITAYRILIGRIGVSSLKQIYDDSSKQLNDNKSFLDMLDKISYIWASISDRNGRFRYGGQGTTKPDKLYFIYKEALKKYGL